MGKSELEILAVRMEEKLTKLIDDHFGGITMDELRQNIRDMRKGDPLRIELIHRINYLDRLKERLRFIQQLEERMEELQAQRDEEGTDRTLGFSDVLGLYAKGRDV
jgi:hypothetical protein